MIRALNWIRRMMDDFYLNKKKQNKLKSKYKQQKKHEVRNQEKKNGSTLIASMLTNKLRLK